MGSLQKDSLSTLLSYSCQCLPRPAHLYSTPTKRANAPAFDAVTSNPDNYLAFLLALPKLADSIENAQSDPGASDMQAFLRSHMPYTILPPPLPQDSHSELNNLLYTDLPTQDIIAIMDACLHNSYNVARAKEILENSAPTDLSRSFTHVFTMLSWWPISIWPLRSQRRGRWVEDAWALLDLLLSGNESVPIPSGAYALALVAWPLRCLYASPCHDVALIISQILV